MSSGRRVPDPETLGRWVESQKESDPELYRALRRGFAERLRAAGHPIAEAPGDTVLESALRLEAPPADAHLVLETIVMRGRPALLTLDQRIQESSGEGDEVSRPMVNRLLEARSVVEPLIPLVGRIDVANFPGSLTYVGTGWIVGEEDGRSIVVTNRHVANLLAHEAGEGFEFRPGRFGAQLDVSVDYVHEHGSGGRDPVEVGRVLWIEPDPHGPDIAFLDVARSAAPRPERTFRLAARDAEPNTDVAVIGYPARGSSDAIPDQAWMDRIYGGVYDVKRVAPGRIGNASRGWATHDCTTLGGNSGSVVVELKTGKAVALHFAGLYMVENYAVPASVIRAYLGRRPWHPGASPQTRRDETSPGRVTARVEVGGSTRANLEIPIRLTVEIGPVRTVGTGDAAGGEADRGAEGGGDAPGGEPRERGTGGESGDGPFAAARALLRRHPVGGLLTSRPGFLISGGRLTNRECVVAAADPAALEGVRASVPPSFMGYPVEVRAATLEEQAAAGAPEVLAEGVTSIAYDDDRRKGKAYSFGWVHEHMKVRLHVGPERSWSELRAFLAGARERLVSSMYEFHAAHIAEAVADRLRDGVSLDLVLARQSRNPRGGSIAEGDFDRAGTFERWREDFGGFTNIFVPTGSSGLVANAYHIKVTVRDGEAVWLSSGNWKRTSQPVIDGDANDPRVTNRAGNREWHVVLENETLARRFQTHILTDLETSRELGGTLEAVEPEVMVDVPVAWLESVELEGPPQQVVEPLEIEDVIRVKPLLTPDRKGRIYSRAVVDLIESAEEEILLQNQYIKLGRAESGYARELLDALVERSREVDLRIILRSGGSDFWKQAEALKYEGLDVDRCLRRLPATHTKGIVVDGRRVLVGSHNWSTLGVTLNRDASLIFDDDRVAQFYRRVFELDWARAGEIVLEESVDLGAARLATGAEPPPGYVRVPSNSYLEG